MKLILLLIPVVFGSGCLERPCYVSSPSARINFVVQGTSYQEGNGYHRIVRGPVIDTPSVQYHSVCAGEAEGFLTNGDFAMAFVQGDWPDHGDTLTVVTQPTPTLYGGNGMELAVYRLRNLLINQNDAYDHFLYEARRSALVLKMEHQLGQ